MSVGVLKKKLYFRLDAGGLIGQGHLSRCQAIFDAFEDSGYESTFVIRSRPSLKQLAHDSKTIWLKEAPDAESLDTESWSVGSQEQEASEMLDSIEPNSIVFLDHYALGLSWQKQLRLRGHKLILLQDVPNANFETDVLINYNLNADQLYNSTMAENKETVFLLGAQYAPLRKVYVQARNEVPTMNVAVQSVGIYLGGVDIQSFKNMANAIKSINYFTNKKIIWVINSNSERDVLNSTFSSEKIEVHVRLPNLMSIYKQVQLFIGACGVSFLERACLGLWQMAFVIADNQADIGKYIQSHKLGVVLGDLRLDTQEDITKRITQALHMDINTRTTFVQNAFSLLDGKGATRIQKKCLEVIG